jgi:hypothetical protein
MRLHEKLALQFGCSPSSVIRAGHFAKAVDYLKDILGQSFEARLLAEQIRPRLTQADVVALAKLPAELLRGRSDADLKELARRAKAPAPSAGLAAAKRAYIGLPLAEQCEFVIWLAARLPKPAPRIAPGCVAAGPVDAQDLGDKWPA